MLKSLCNPVTLRLRRLSVEIDKYFYRKTSEAPSQTLNRIWRELLRLQYNKVIKSLRHEPNQIDIIWLGELVKRLGNSPHLRRHGL